MSMKSSRLRFVLGTAAQNRPSVQMSPWCIGCAVSWALFHVGFPVRRLRDWLTYRYQSASESAFGVGLPVGSLGTTVGVRRYATSTCPGLPAAIVAKSCGPV